MHLLKKYSNRRIYDTNISAYITLDEVRVMVENYAPFQVIDAKTKEDITAQVLLQIIIERESKFSASKRIFTQKLLEQIIRSYNNPLQTATSFYMEQTMDFLKNVKQSSASNPMDMWSSILNENFKTFQNILGATNEDKLKTAENNNSEK